MTVSSLYPLAALTASQALADRVSVPLVVAGLFVFCTVPAVLTPNRAWHPALRFMAIPLGLMGTLVVYPATAWILEIIGYDPTAMTTEALAIATASMPFLFHIQFQSWLFKRAESATSN